MCNPGFSPYVRCKVSPEFLRDSEEKLKDEFIRWKFEKTLGLPASCLLNQMSASVSAHSAWLGCHGACDSTCDGMSHSVFSSSTLGSCPPAPPSWKQKIQREGGRGVFFKHKNFFDVLKWKEIRNKACWMLECDIWKLLGNVSLTGSRLWSQRGKTSSSPSWQRLCCSECSSSRLGIHCTILTTSPPFQGCCREQALSDSVLELSTPI